MLYEEFIALTGYRPSYEEYVQIERNYMAFDGDKQAFCKAWVMVNSATVEQYKIDTEKLSKMEAKEIELVNCILDAESVIERTRAHLAVLEKRKANFEKSVRKLRHFINTLEDQMMVNGVNIHRTNQTRR